jgi:hypothetical protein
MIPSTLMTDFWRQATARWPVSPRSWLETALNDCAPGSFVDGDLRAAPPDLARHAVLLSRPLGELSAEERELHRLGIKVQLRLEAPTALFERGVPVVRVLDANPAVVLAGAQSRDLGTALTKRLKSTLLAVLPWPGLFADLLPLADYPATSAAAGSLQPPRLEQIDEALSMVSQADPALHLQMKSMISAIVCIPPVEPGRRKSFTRADAYLGAVFLDAYHTTPIELAEALVRETVDIGAWWCWTTEPNLRIDPLAEPIPLPTGRSRPVGEALQAALSAVTCWLLLAAITNREPVAAQRLVAQQRADELLAKANTLINALRSRVPARYAPSLDVLSAVLP